MLDKQEIAVLAQEARSLGYTTNERIISRLTRMLERNHSYLEYRRKSGRRTSHDETTAEDCLVLALLIEKLQQEGENR